MFKNKVDPPDRDRQSQVVKRFSSFSLEIQLPVLLSRNTDINPSKTYFSSCRSFPFLGFRKVLFTVKKIKKGCQKCLNDKTKTQTDGLTELSVTTNTGRREKRSEE